MMERITLPMAIALIRDAEPTQNPEEVLRGLRGGSAVLVAAGCKLYKVRESGDGDIYFAIGGYAPDGSDVRRALERAQVHCVCEPGDPCDYHAATCVTCPDRKCQGHPRF